MKRRDYKQILSPEDRLRVRFTEDRGRILQFVVGYDVLYQGRWRVLMSFDNCHGSSPHKHTYYLQSSAYKVDLNMSSEEALTESKKLILEHLQTIRANYFRH